MDGRNPGGGSRLLGELVEEHGSVLVSDLQRYYQVDLGQTVSGEGYSPRRILVFLENMPPGSKSKAVLGNEPDAEGWDAPAYLLAGLVDAVRENTFVTAQVQSKKKLKRPEPMDVPGRKAQKKTKGQNNLFAQMAAQQMRASRKG